MWCDFGNVQRLIDYCYNLNHNIPRLIILPHRCHIALEPRTLDTFMKMVKSLMTHPRL